MTKEFDNISIGEFIGMQQTDLGWFDNDEVLHLSDNTFDLLLFDKSWDWLMPVVEKINSISINSKVISVEIHDKYVMIKHGFTLLIDVEGDTMFDAVYESVVAFIKWYNENK
jgi:hypothetical protein